MATLPPRVVLRREGGGRRAMATQKFDVSTEDTALMVLQLGEKAVRRFSQFADDALILLKICDINLNVGRGTKLFIKYYCSKLIGHRTIARTPNRLISSVSK